MRRLFQEVCRLDYLPIEVSAFQRRLKLVESIQLARFIPTASQTDNQLTVRFIPTANQTDNQLTVRFIPTANQTDNQLTGTV